VAQDQPWRNPRPAPSLAEMQARMEPPHAWSWLRTWWPALAWAAVIFVLSTDSFSSEKTATFLDPVLRWLMPSMSKELFRVLHHFIRKSAHFTEYFIFCLLIYRGVRSGRTGWRWSWGLEALACAAGYSILDEIHQAFVASRMASAYDSLLDSIGAFFAVGVLWLWFRFRQERANSQLKTT
jgi:VanZ family protein